jgi:hypothetical protein
MLEASGSRGGAQAKKCPAGCVLVDWIVNLLATMPKRDQLTNSQEGEQFPAGGEPWRV